MALSRLQRQWQHAAQRFGLRVKTPFKLQFADGHGLFADVLLEGYGAPKGMLIFSDHSAVAGMTESVIAAGYGYSCMSHPSESEIESLDGIQDVLADWGPSTNS